MRTFPANHKREALKWFRENSVSTDSSVAYAKMTVSDAVDNWLKSLAIADKHPNTLRNYRDAIGYLRRDMGSSKLTAVGTTNLIGWVEELRKSGGSRGQALSSETVRLAVNTAKMVFEFAHTAGWISRDPAAPVPTPSQKRTPQKQQQKKQKQWRGWTVAERDLFRAAAADHRLHGLFLLSTLGLRRGEVAGLRWTDIDFDANTIAIERARVEIAPGTDEEVPTKTERSDRTLPLPEDLAGVLRVMKRRQQEERLGLGVSWADDSYLMSVETGEPMRVRSYSQTFARIVKRAGLPPITLRDLRSVSVSLMRSEYPAHLIAAWHGHSETLMKDTYTNVHRDDLAAMAQTMRVVAHE